MNKDDERTISTPETPLEITEKYDPYQVALEHEDDPLSLPLWRRWLAAIIIDLGAACVTGASAMVSWKKSSFSARAS